MFAPSVHGLEVWPKDYDCFHSFKSRTFAPHQGHTRRNKPYRTVETAVPLPWAAFDRICTCTRRFCARPAAVLFVATS